MPFSEITETNKGITVFDEVTSGKRNKSTFVFVVLLTLELPLPYNTNFCFTQTNIVYLIILPSFATIVENNLRVWQTLSEGTVLILSSFDHDN